MLIVYIQYNFHSCGIKGIRPWETGVDSTLNCKSSSFAAKYSKTLPGFTQAKLWASILQVVELVTEFSQENVTNRPNYNHFEKVQLVQP